MIEIVYRFYLLPFLVEGQGEGFLPFLLFSQHQVLGIPCRCAAGDGEYARFDVVHVVHLFVQRHGDGGVNLSFIAFGFGYGLVFCHCFSFTCFS